jgi:hypothetical protein
VVANLIAFQSSVIFLASLDQKGQAPLFRPHTNLDSASLRYN